MIRVTKGPQPHLCSITWRVTYRNARPNDMKYTFTIDHEIHGPNPEECAIILSRQLGQYGGLSFEQIGEINEITN